RVVTFGSQGLFNAGPTVTPGGNIGCPTPDGDVIAAGTLGNNSAACNSGVCAGKDNAVNYSHTPVYVRIAGGGFLEGITQVSKGDGWYFAIAASGDAYAWGFNRRGELGLGDYIDRCHAVPFVLPAGCDFTYPCPGQPRLGADQVVCPVFSQVLHSQVPQTYNTYKYTWEYRASAGDAWTTLEYESDDISYDAAEQLGEYRVVISDERLYVSSLCGPCPLMIDTIVFTEQPSPYVVTACKDDAAELAEFTVLEPEGSEIKWYTGPTGGTELNPSDTDSTIMVPFTSTNTGLGACDMALFAEDISSLQGTVLPGTTSAELAASLGVGGEACGAGSWTADWESNTRNYMMIEVTQDVRMTAASLITGSAGNGTFEIRIFDNNPTGGPYCGGCTPAGSKNAPGTVRYTSPGLVATVTNNQIIEVPMDHELEPGIYWIGIAADGVQARYFNCAKTINNTGAYPTWNNPYSDDTGSDVVTGLMGFRDGNYGTRGAAFNIKFETGTGYTCGRILVCVDSDCVLPITLLNFNAEKEGNNAILHWSTANEQNSSHFVVQKSLNGKDFESLGEVSAAGFSNTIRNYSYTDENLAAGTNYYRLAQYDVDGSLTMSDVVIVNTEAVTGIKVMPNPNNGIFNVLIEGKGQNPVKLILLNTLGQVVSQNEENPNTMVEFNFSNLPSGVYFLHAKTEDGNYVEKIVIE
ncbi:MAG: T9SS type A sorting domain-containing protein, partial [Cytophagaceae bacterium]